MASHTVTPPKAKPAGAQQPDTPGAAGPQNGRVAAAGLRDQRLAAAGAAQAPSEQAAQQLERALGALYGAAIGSALGAPTRFLSPAQISAQFPELEGFIPITPQDLVGQGLPERGLTEEIEALLTLGERLVDGRDQAGAPAAAGRATRRALAGADQPEAAVALLGVPLGIAAATGTATGIVEAVEEVTTPGEVTCIATAGAAAVAAAVRAAIDGATVPEALAAGCRAAELGERRGRYVPGASVAQRIEWSLQIVGSCDAARARRLLHTLVGTGAQIQEAIPTAFSLALLWPDEPWRVCLEAALLGGASDTIAAVAGAIVAAVSGTAGLPPEAVRMIDRAGGHRLDDLTRSLIDLR
jgi:ADP-ribosylglycohydrolase